MKVQIVLGVFVTLAILQTEAGQNVVLGSFSGASASKFGSGSTETRYVNNNGIQQAYTVHTSYEQKPDHSCVKRTVESRDGVENVQEEVVDCQEAQRLIGENQKKTQKDLKEHQEKLDSEIRKHQREIEDSIKDQMKEMNNHFLW